MSLLVASAVTSMRINTQMKPRGKKLQMLAMQLYKSQVRRQAQLCSVALLPAVFSI
jgi:hypothetical protein